MFSFVSFDVYVSFKLIHHMRRGVAKPVPWVGKAPGGEAVTVLAMCLRGRLTTMPLPSLPERTQPM